MKKIFLSLGIGTFLIVALLKRVSLSDILQNIASVDLGFFGVAFVAYMIANVFRVERFYVLVERKISRREFFPILFIYNFLNVISPVLGVASYLHLVGKTGTMSFGRHTSVFISSRVVDAIIVAILFIVFFLRAVGGRGESGLLILAALLLIFVIGIFFAVIFWGKKISEFFRKQLERGIGRWQILDSFFNHMDDMADGFVLLRGNRILAPLFLLTLFIWLALFLSGFFLLQSAGLTIGLFKGMFSYAFPIFASLLPITVPASIGTYEMSLVSGLLLVGVSKTAAITASFTMHIQELVFIITGGTIGFLCQFLKKIIK
ncbi:MAG: lysylphosphatidylglycerol synthase transmembrane domain-containing protein [Patescibacteria group bacterium]